MNDNDSIPEEILKICSKLNKEPSEKFEIAISFPRRKTTSGQGGLPVWNIIKKEKKEIKKSKNT